MSSNQFTRTSYITVEPLLWDTSIQGTPPFRRHKIWSQKSAHIIFESISGALWVRKCGKLPIRENLVITWPYTERPPDRPFAPQVYQWKITQSTGMATQNATRAYFDGKSHSHLRLVKQRQLKSQWRRKRNAEIVSVSVFSKVLSLD